MSDLRASCRVIDAPFFSVCTSKLRVRSGAISTTFMLTFPCFVFTSTYAFVDLSLVEPPTQRSMSTLPSFDSRYALHGAWFSTSEGLQDASACPFPLPFAFWIDFRFVPIDAARMGEAWSGTSRFGST